MTSQWTSAADSGNYVGIPSNILTVHVNDLIFAAMPVLRYDQFAVIRTDLTVQKGSTISFSKYGNLSGGGVIAEDANVETKAMSKSTVPITVTEYMNAIGLTQKYLTMAFMDEMQTASILLGRNYAKVTDDMLRDAVFGGTQTVLAGGISNIWDLDTANVFSTVEVDAAVEILKTNNALPFVDANGEYYIGVFHPHCLRYIKKELVSVRQYAYPELIWKGETGEYNMVRFIETANVPNGAVVNTDTAYTAALVEAYDNGGANLNKVDLYKGVIFGERAYGWAIALPVELREDPGFSTYGRVRGLAYYTIQGAAKILNEAIVVVITA